MVLTDNHVQIVAVVMVDVRILHDNVIVLLDIQDLIVRYYLVLMGVHGLIWPKVRTMLTMLPNAPIWEIVIELQANVHVKQDLQEKHVNV